MKLDNLKIYSAYNKSPYLSIKHSTYFPVYEKIFGRFRDKEITIVEIGILNGGSLFMWREFFGPKARIIGIDLNPDAKRWEDDGFEIYIGSQSDHSFWDAFVKKVGKVDILLDDGGHTFEQQIVTVECMLPYIKDDGIIVIEDAHTSYMKEFGSQNPYTFIAYAKNIVDGINYRFSKIKDNNFNDIIWSVSFFESIVMFHIDRELCALQSVPTENSGKSFNAIDYRYSDSKSNPLGTTVKGKFRMLKIVPFAKPLYRLISSVSADLKNKAKIRTLKKYFRY